MRVIGEKSELDTRIFALEQFFDSPLFANVDTEEQSRLKEQCMYMVSYAAVLEQRIAAFPPVPELSPTLDNVTELNPQLAGQAIFKEEVPIGAEPIADVDAFAMHVDHWHAQKMEQGNRFLELPEGTTIEVEDHKTPGEVIAMDLNGPYLQVFRVGVETVLNIFKDLPFGASIEDAPEGTGDDNAAA